MKYGHSFRVVVLAAVAAAAIAGCGAASRPAGTPSHPVSSQAPAAQQTTPAAANTYQDGYSAASAVSPSQVYNYNPDGEVAGAGWYWCERNDPTPNAPTNEGATGPEGQAPSGTPWFDGCAASMKDRNVP